MCMPDWGQSLTPTENVGRGFILRPTLPAQWAVRQWRCLRRVLCLVRSPVTNLDCNLLKDRNLTLVPRQGPDINSRTCRWELPKFCHGLWCWFPSQRLILFLRSCLETPKAGSGPTNPEAEPLHASPSAFRFLSYNLFSTISDSIT
jgi:hypothetical protein